jgi:rubrerythrin
MVEYTQEERYSKPKNIKDLLTIALTREKAAVGFYGDMLKHSFAQIEIVKDLIEELKKAEEGHVRRLERKLDEL